MMKINRILLFCYLCIYLVSLVRCAYDEKIVRSKLRLILYIYIYIYISHFSRYIKII